MLASKLLCRSALTLIFVLMAARLSEAVAVHGTVSDPLGRPVSNATVALVQKGQVIATGHTLYDGSYQLSSSASGQFNVLAGGVSFRQLLSKNFYGATLDSIEQNIVLEPEWVHQSIVVTATGTPQPQAQVSANIATITKTDFLNRAEMVDPLRQINGFDVVQTGQRGGVTSVFIRGGNSDSNKVLLDGIPIEDIGGRFDLSTISSTGISSVEAYRGPNSVLWGSDAAAGVIAFDTPRGTTSFPSLLYEGDAGSFGTYRNEVQLGGTLRKFDYYGGFADLQTKNSLPMDEYHNITSVANLGYQLSGATSVRLTARNADVATGLPGTYSFFGMSNDGKQSDQDISLSGTIDHSFSDAWHGLVRYGMARKREEEEQWYPAGHLIEGNYYGNQVTIHGANGYSASGQALMNFGGTYPYTLDLVSNRDNLYAQTDYSITPHLTAIAGFRYEDERGAEKEFAYGLNETLERANYDYMLTINGEYKQRIFYSLAGGIQKNQLYGTQGTPRAGVSYYAIRPGKGIFHGTKVNFNYAQGVKEPTIDDQFGSLYTFLLENGGASTIHRLGITPIGAEQSRSYDGGVEQSLFDEHVLLRATYFHNEFGRQIEYVGANLVPQLLPQLSSAEQQQLESFLESEGAFALTLNSMAFRAQGLETEVEYGIGKNIFMRGGYTYLDGQVQRSFSSDAVGPSTNPNIPGVLIGNVSPLDGARPFRRPPHTGFASVSYTGKSLTVVGTGAFASRSDDSTYLGGEDPFGENTLLLPNRNLDSGYAKLDLGGTFRLTSWLGIYAQLDNLLSQQHIGPIGYPSLPMNYRLGLRFSIGHPRKTQ
ncbi:iron complex outermembrane receptor protein/vitamin B12 transporter [Silvibacterium bohemicum]|uniref:Iron complex outermembrane receptor protein/vitamin B12 transporter n=1 Tax=Silvibacterium bohemicum TaxID=1577686 RepID=A0A841JZE8_9BACT|nr:TonB-dependent receptor plug domain-containing protein [Silvibacterium bohemicum]MBB6146696.1 iron complex outermembrane receptor protein/vitamin B12 transporter [Silvibacterium bohemicum]